VWPAVVIAGALIGAACGGGSGKKAADNVTTTSTTSAVADEGTTTTVGTAQTGATVAPGALASTTTTAAKKSTATTRKPIAAAPAPKAINAGATNVTSAPTTAPAADVQPGGTITYLKVSDITGFDPSVLTYGGSSDGPPGYMVFDVLFYNDPKDGLVKPQVADSLTTNDATTWTMKLKPNIRFTDGTAYDANAVKFNWQRLQDPKLAAKTAASANLMQSIDVIDPLTLRLTLKQKNAVFPYSVSQIPFIGSPAAIQQKGDGFMSDPVGAGPFTLKQWVRNGSMTFVRNPNYWAAPRPYVDQVIIKPITDEAQRINSFAAGEANLVFTGVPDSAAQLQKSGGVPYPAILNGGKQIAFNVRKAPFNDAERARPSPWPLTTRTTPRSSSAD